MFFSCSALHCLNWDTVSAKLYYSSSTRLSKEYRERERERERESWAESRKIEVDDTVECILHSVLSEILLHGLLLLLPCQKELVFMPASSSLDVGRPKLVHCMQWYLCPTFCKTKRENWSFEKVLHYEWFEFLPDSFLPRTKRCRNARGKERLIQILDLIFGNLSVQPYFFVSPWLVQKVCKGRY